MANVHGKDSVFSIDDTADSLTDISAYVDTVDGLPGSIELAETSALGDEAKTYIAGLEDATISIGGPWDATLDGYIGTQAQRKTARGIAFGPAGSAGGSIKESAEVFIQDYTIPASVSDAVRWSASLVVTGGVTRGTY